MYEARPSVVTLSRGGTWNPRPWDAPYTLPNDVVGGAWPDGSSAQTIFYDTSGGVLGVVAGTVAPDGITFMGDPAVVDLVPNGANFEIFLTTSGGDPYLIRYGRVVRREVEFLQSGTPAASSGQAFSDSWPTTGIKSTWVQMALTRTVVHDNSGVSLDNGVGSPNVGSGQTDTAMRWFRPLDGNNAKVEIVALNQHNYTASSFTRMRVIVCSDQAMTSYIAAEFYAGADISDTHVNQISFLTGTGPTAVSYVGSPVTHLVHDSDDYTVNYDAGTDTLTVYAGTDLTPIATRTATGVPVGPGHRYLGLAWSTSANTDGLQATSWEASDEL